MTNQAQDKKNIDMNSVNILVLNNLINKFTIDNIDKFHISELGKQIYEKIINEKEIIE